MNCRLQSLLTCSESEPPGAMPGTRLLGQGTSGPRLTWKVKPSAAGGSQLHPTVPPVWLVMVCVALQMCLSCWNSTSGDGLSVSAGGTGVDVGLAPGGGPRTDHS